MAATRIDMETFLTLATRHPVIDVRSEGEYAHAHIPGAFSMPLFNNDERKIVGTAYKQQSKQKAIKIGLQFFGKKMVEMVETVEEQVISNSGKTGETASKTIIVHCWRGGMRSGGVAWLLDLYGFKVYTIAGGYKAYRHWVLEQLSKEYSIKILGGYTGSGKTHILHGLKKFDQTIIDLEAIANHRGSAFGDIGMPPQPTQEMFENLLAKELWKATGTVDQLQQPNSDKFNPQTTIWMEDESQRIGQVNIPTPFFAMMRSKPVYFLDIPFEERLQHIVKEYGKGEKEKLVNAIIRIKKRLGGMETKLAINYLVEDNLEACFSILLKYYDKQYLKGLHHRQNLAELLHTVPCNTVNEQENAKHILEKQTQKVNA